MILETKAKKRIYFIICYIILVIITTTVFRQYTNEQIEQQLMTSLEDLSQQNIVLIKNKLQDKLNELNNLAEKLKSNANYTYEEVQYDLEEFSSVLEFKELGIVLPDGTAYMSNDMREHIEYDFSDREYFQHSKNGEEYISEIINHIRDGSKVNVYSVPIVNKKGEVTGVLLGIKEAEDFVQGFQVPIFDGKGYTYLMDSEGNVMSGSLGNVMSGTLSQNDETSNLFDTLKKYDGNEKAISTLSKLLEENKSGSVYMKDNGYEYANVSPINVNDWWLVTVVPKKVLEERVKAISYAMQILSACITLGAIIVLVFIVRMQKKSEKYLKNIAYINPFTGLYNKVYFEKKFLSNIKAVQGKKAALVIYNIRRFKMINEIYGEHIGNALLKELACILQDNIKFDKEMVMYGHADEFAGLYFYHTKEELEDRIYHILQQLEIIECANNKIQLSMAVGIYEVQNLEYSFEKAYNYANIAKKNSKKSSGSSLEYYSEQLRDIELNKKQLNDSIREGIQKREFKAWLQPKFDANTEEIIGAEALVRWHKEDGSILSPFYFIEFSEQAGLIQEIDRLILEDVCIKMNEWKKQGLPCVPVSVNLSRAYLNNVNSIYSLKKILDDYNISSEYIQLEITESAIVDSEEQLSNVIDTMHKLGFQVLLDDFGVGYSSLISINNLNFDILKIDKSFIDTIGTEKGEYITKYIIELGKKLGMVIIAEGVETEDEYNFLKKQKCDMIQGYYFSKPLPAEEFKELLRTSIS